MALHLKYWLEYHDVVNVLHRTEIYQDIPVVTELVLNGDFQTTDNWTLGAGWSINTIDNYAQFFGGGVNLDTLVQPDVNYTAGRTYEVTYTVDSLTGNPNEVRFVFNGATNTNGQWRTGSIGGTTHTEQITLLSGGVLTFEPISNNADLKVYDISVKEVVPPIPVPSEIYGKVQMNYASPRFHLEPIRGSGLNLMLEASTNLTFEDLYSKQERTFAVKYFRDGIVTFDGWLNPEGLFQNFVQDKWVITLQCVDGIGYLRNLTFLDPFDLQVVSGRKTALELVTICLQRTSVLQNINISVDIYYDGLAETLDVFDNIYFNSSRYIKLDLSTIMSCRDVLIDLLEIFSACIVAVHGEWYIYKPNQFSENPSQTFFRYDSDGVPLAPATKTIDFSEVLGSQINGRYPHHARGNQSMSNDPSLGAYRIEYKYGLTQSLIQNSNLTNIGGVIADFTINNPAWVDLPPSGEAGVPILNTDNSGSFDAVLTTDEFAIEAGIELAIAVNWNINRPNQPNEDTRYRIILREDLPPNKDYAFSWQTNDWVYDSVIGYFLPIASPSQIQTISLPPTPVNGQFYVIIHRPYLEVVPNEFFELRSFTINPVAVGGSDTVTGETHTFERTDRPSTKIDVVEAVFNGDNDSDIWEGTIYKNDTITPTTTWHRKGFTTEDDQKGILVIMGDEKMRMNGQPSRTFKGAIFGYFNYLSVITIDGVEGKFMFLEWRYDTKANIIEAEFKQIQSDELPDLEHTKANNIGTNTTPTITGFKLT